MDRSVIEPGAQSAVPTGTVTFAFTDIEGSTVRWDRHPTAMRLAVRRHDDLARAAFERHGGYVFKALGDAFCCAFTLPSDAVAAALDLQASLTGEDFAAVDGLRVRIALHTGSADERDGDYFGPTLNRTARLLAIAHGGQTVVSQVTYELAAPLLPAAVVFADLGTHRLRDLTLPEHVYGIHRAGLRAGFPPLRSLTTLPNNLPVARTSFVGREREVADVGALLGGNRMVTLTGSGGIGKTRISLAVAANVLDRFRDGVWLVELAPLTDGSLVAETVANVLGIAPATYATANAALVAALRAQNVLLILDNCEHLVGDVAALAAAILRDAPDVSILASSRESLKIAGESTYRVPSLDVPAQNVATSLDPERAGEFGAIALFAERATAADRRFRLTVDNVPTVVDIVRRLDGIALAIELCAARTKMLDLRQLRARIDERFRLLTGGSRDVLPRQQTLRALIDWSYDLLDERDRTLFVRSAIFVGGFTLDAAVAVCADSTLDEFDVLDGLASLVDKSLVVAEAQADTMRYRLLESTRLYALERSIAAGEREPLAARHAEWMAAAAERWYATYWTTPARRWLPAVIAELDNIRAALTWLLDDARDASAAALIAGGLEGLWHNGGLAGEGLRWIETIFARLGSAPPDVTTLAVLWATRARLSFAKGMVDAADAAIALFERTHADVARANAHHMRAVGLRRMGRLAEAQIAIDRALQLFSHSGVTATWPYVKALDTRAGILRFAGRIDEARALRFEALLRFEELGDEHGAAGVRVNLADLEALHGDPRHAIALSEEAARTYRAAGEISAEATALINVAAFRLLLDDVDAAATAARAGLSLAVRAGWQQGIAIAVQHIATVCAERGEWARAAAFIGFVDEWYAAESFAREPTEQRCYERTMTLLRRQLPGQRLEPFLDAGARRPIDEVVRETLER